MDVDEILEEIGSFGRYQKLLLALLCFPVTFALPYTFMGQLFQSVIPHHWCLVPQLMDLSINDRKALAIPKVVDDEGEHFSKCLMHDFNYTHLVEIYGRNVSEWTALNVSSAIQEVQKLNHSGVSCLNGWEFDFNEFRPTASSDWNWVCEDDYKPYVSLAIFFIGSSCGAMLFGYISDRYGRAPTALIANAVACLANVATAFTQEFISFSTMRFFAGLTFDLSHMAYYILVMEYIAADRRTACSNLSFGIFFTAGSVLLPWLAYAAPNWRYFCIITAIPFALLLPFFRYIPESARWLIAQNRVDEAVDQLKVIAEYNKKQLKDDMWERARSAMAEAANKEKKKKKYNYLDLFRRPKLRLRTFLMTFMWFVVMLAYDGLVRNTENLGWDMFLSSTLGNATEFPAALIPLFLIDRLGRRITSIGCYVLAAAVCFSVLLVPSGMTWLFVTLAVVARLLVTCMMNLLIQYQAEIFPTVVRAQGVSFVHLMGFVGSMSSPFIVYLGHYRREYPLLIFGGISFIGAILALFLPETLYETLPENLDDGERFGENQTMFYFPRPPQNTSNNDDEQNINSLKADSRKPISNITTRL